MNLKVMIADDEEMMRTILKKAISKVDGFTIVGEVDNGFDALDMFKKEKPDVVFLDVEMGEMNGLECARLIVDINPKTKIVFATAHNEYMLEAFEVYAFDYLVKPYKIDRVYKTLEKIKVLTEVEVPKMFVSKEDLTFDKLLIKNKEGVTFLDTKDIILIQREEGATVIYTTDGGSYTTSEGLTDLEERLDNKIFFRSHKSYIINLYMINKIYPYGRWTYIVKLKNTTCDALITHEKYEDIKRMFN